MHAVILHGAVSAPEENWFAWLAAELERSGIEAVVPRLPTPEGHSLVKWFSAFDCQCAHVLSTDSVLIGHSIGALFALRLLERASGRIRLCALVSPFLEPIGNDYYDHLNSTFFLPALNRASMQAETFLIYHGSDDRYVPLEFGRRCAAFLGSELVVIAEGGHLNAESGFRQFPRLRDDVRRELNVILQEGR